MAIVISRVIILYLVIMVSMRILGKRQLGEMEPNELVLAMLISDLASVPMQDMGIPLLNGLLPIATLVALNMLISIISSMNIRFRTVVSGTSSIIIKNGQINQLEMCRNRFTVDELMEELRLQGYVDISKIKYGILESNGRMSVIPFSSQAPPTADDMGLNVSDSDLQTIIVNAGHVLTKNLIASGHNEAWLEKQLRQRKIKSVRDIYLLTVDEQEKVYVCLRDTQVKSWR